MINLTTKPGDIPIDIEKMRENLIVDPRFLSHESSKRKLDFTKDSFSIPPVTPPKPTYNVTNNNFDIPPISPPKQTLDFTNNSFHISPIHSPIAPVNPNVSPIAPVSPIKSCLSSYSPISENNSSDNVNNSLLILF